METTEGTERALDSGAVSEMQRLESIINTSHSEGLTARWESGRCMLAMRKGKQLPTGVLANLAKELDVHASELTARMKFAKRYSKDKLPDAIRKYKTWFAVTHKGLTTTPRMKTGDSASNSSLKRVLELLANFDPAAGRDGDLELLGQIEEAIQRLRAGFETLNVKAA